MGIIPASSQIDRLYLSSGCSSFLDDRLKDLPADYDVFAYRRTARKTFVDGCQQSYQRSDPTKEELLGWLTKNIDDWSHRAADNAHINLFFSTHGFEAEGQTYLAWKDTSLQNPSTLLSLPELLDTISPWFTGYPKRCGTLILQTCQSPLPYRPSVASHTTFQGNLWILFAVEKGTEEGWETLTTQDKEDFSAFGRLTRRICSLWEELGTSMPFQEFWEKLRQIYIAERLPPPRLLCLGEPRPAQWHTKRCPTNAPTDFEGRLFEAFREGHSLYGRNNALRAILGVRFDRDWPHDGWLYENERILFYGPSGAGKTSLICAGVIPWLMKAHQRKVFEELKKKYPEQEQTRHEELAKDDAQRAIRYVDLSIEDIPSEETLKNVSFLFLDQAESKIAQQELTKLKTCISVCERANIRVVVLLREDFVGEWRRLWRERPSFEFVDRILAPLSEKEAEEVLFNTMPPLLSADEKKNLLCNVAVASATTASSSTVGTYSPVLLQAAMKDAWKRREQPEGDRIRSINTIWAEEWRQVMECTPPVETTLSEDSAKNRVATQIEDTPLDEKESRLAVLSAFIPIKRRNAPRRRFTEQQLFDWLVPLGLSETNIQQNCAYLVERYWLRKVSDAESTAYVLSHDVLLPIFSDFISENSRERERRLFFSRLQYSLSVVERTALQDSLLNLTPDERKRLRQQASFWWQWLRHEDDAPPPQPQICSPIELRDFTQALDSLLERDAQTQRRNRWFKILNAATIFLLLAAVLLSNTFVKFRQMTPTELKFSPKSAYESIPSLVRESKIPPMPVSIDLSERMPLPGNQGSQGSSVAWTVAYAKSYHENTKRLVTSGNRRLMYSPSFLYNSMKLKEGKGCSGGLSMHEALQFVVKHGLPLLSDFPYDPKNCLIHPSSQVKIAASKHKALTFEKIEIVDLKKTYIIQDVLINGLPILIGIHTHPSLRLYKGGLYTPSGLQGRGHAMLVVGYDAAKNAYKIMNSWGQDWGDKGFVWMTPEVLSSIAKEAYVLFDQADSSTEWGRYQRCLSEKGPRCCDHMGALASKAKLCASVPMDRWKIFQWCVETGQPRCCDHLTVELGKQKKVCGYATEERMLELYQQCSRLKKTGCCYYLSPPVAQKHKLCARYDH